MKLAEALIERADLKNKIEILRSRMQNNAKVQEGMIPNENPQDLQKELDEKFSRLEFLIVHINKTNELTRLESGQTLSELIAKRDILSKKISILGDFLHSGNYLIERISHSEIKVKPTFDVKIYQKKVDNLSKELRLIDTKLQENNWLTELI